MDALAHAEEQSVLKLWAGLGYYRRAKNLMAAARAVVEKHGGEIPSDYDELLALPGIGQYMAQSIPAADFPAIAGVTLLLGVVYVAVNTIVDILQAVADPRIDA